MMLIIGIAMAMQPSSFDGTWVLRVNQQNILKLMLKNGATQGTLTKAKTLTLDESGDVTAIDGPPVSLPVRSVRVDGGRLNLTIDGDQFQMSLAGRDRATLSLEGMRPWTLDRVRGNVTLATRLAEPRYPSRIRKLREQLRAMVKEDQAARLAFDDTRIAAADAANRTQVLRIFGQYGWITHSLAGKDAAHDFWLLVQHQSLELQQRMLPSLENAAKRGDASMSDFAYLFDRVQVGLGKPQRWGTQVKCEAGQPVLQPVEDPGGLDGRRKELNMMAMEAYLASDYLRKVCAK